MPLPDEHRTILLSVARDSIRHGLRERAPLPVAATSYAEPLRDIRATFVTLEKNSSLRGCIGTLEPRLPLVEDVALRAYEAAFEDPRFSPVTQDEFPVLAVRISILTPAIPLPCASEEELLQILRPGCDGLILTEGRRRATFLPSVWDQLVSPREFLTSLKQKAGLPASYWSPTIRFQRYEAESVEDE